MRDLRQEDIFALQEVCGHEIVKENTNEIYENEKSGDHTAQMDPSIIQSHAKKYCLSNCL